MNTKMLSGRLHEAWMPLFSAVLGIPLTAESRSLMMSVMDQNTSFAPRKLFSWKRLFLSADMKYTETSKLNFRTKLENVLPLQRFPICEQQSFQGRSPKERLHFYFKRSQIVWEKVQLKNKWSWVSCWLLQRRHAKSELGKWSLSWVPNLSLIASQRMNPHLGMARGNQMSLCQCTKLWSGDGDEIETAMVNSYSGDGEEVETVACGRFFLLLRVLRPLHRQSARGLRPRA